MRRLGTDVVPAVAHALGIPDGHVGRPPSDLVLPDTDTSLEEVRLLLESTSEYLGLIPDGEPATDVEKEPETN